jgi:hypothetical protein
MRQTSLAAWSRMPARIEGFARRIPPPPTNHFRVDGVPGHDGFVEGCTLGRDLSEQRSAAGADNALVVEVPRPREIAVQERVLDDYPRLLCRSRVNGT